MTKEKHTSDLKAYLEEHLAYERRMLTFTFEMLFQTDGPRWCAVFESFGIHARNLYDFLRHEGKATTTIRAVDYVPNRKKSEALATIDAKMNSSLFHLSTSRLENKPVTVADAVVIGSWIDREWQAWAAQLPESFRALVDTEPACLLPSDRASVSPSATGHVSALPDDMGATTER